MKNTENTINSTSDGGGWGGKEEEGSGECPEPDYLRDILFRIPRLRSALQIRILYFKWGFKRGLHFRLFFFYNLLTPFVTLYLREFEPVIWFLLIIQILGKTKQFGNTFCQRFTDIIEWAIAQLLFPFGLKIIFKWLF